jgi:type IV pilus assembly protein PilN
LAATQREIDGLDREEAQARAILNKPVNKEIADQSDFLNELFARKALSWTRIFTELEKIVPADLHVVSMKPEYTKTNDLVLHIVVATDSRDRAVEMVRHMEKSSHFRQAQVVAESVVGNTSVQTAGPASNIQFDIAAVYVPTGADTEDAPATKAAEAAPSPPVPVPVLGAAAPANKASNADAVAPQNGQPNVRAAQSRPMNPGLRGH